jgi:hypothetical protein
MQGPVCETGWIAYIRSLPAILLVGDDKEVQIVENIHQISTTED